MEDKHRTILNKLYQEIVRDLDVQDILTKLIAEKVIDESLDEILRKIEGKEAQARRLLSHIKTRGKTAYPKFKEALESNYSWMVEKMDLLEQQPFNGIDVTDASPASKNPSLCFPAMPPLNVMRKQKMEQLRDGLKNLEPKKYLALHGMPGWGKSTLVGTTLYKDQSLYQFFKNEIYWIKFRRRKTNDENDLSNNILNQLNELLHEVRNSDQLTEPTNRDSLIYSLKKYFSNHDQALIILDHADKKEMIDAFDFGCKTLVLTANLEVLEGKDSTVIKMNEGFIVEESLDLFAKAIGLEASALPKQAKQIHEECKGMPLMISMYAAYFQDIKESLVNDKDGTKVWLLYLNDLRSKSSILEKIQKKLSTTFEMCIKNLTNDGDDRDGDKEMYYILSIFPEDINITPEMLSIAWDFEHDAAASAIVHSKMLKFYKKSMVVRQWNEKTKDYIYGVHDLMLRYLRDKLGPVKLKEYHRSYIEKYLTKANGDYSKLFPDNYIYAYIGYHMKEAGLTDKFSEVYLDFGFIESKILQTGPGDLLIDLKKYRKYITHDSPELTKKVEDLKTFLIEQAATLAEYRHRNCLDIVQVALNHSNQGFVRENAERLASESCGRVYFKLNKQTTKDFDHVSVDLQMQVSAIAFTNETGMILAGTEDGEVVWWNCRNRKRSFLLSKRNAYPVRKIVYSEMGEFFVSLSEHGTAKLFDLKERFDDQFANHCPKYSDIQSKQKHHKIMHSDSIDRDDSRTDFVITDHKITDITVSTDGQKVAACTATGRVAVWNADGELLAEYCPTSLSLVSIAFICSNTKLCVANLVDRIMVLEASNCAYQTQFSLSSVNKEIISLLSVPKYTNFVIALTKQELVSIRWILDEDIFRRPSMVPFAKLDSPASSLLSYKSAVVMPDGQYVATSDTGGSVNVYNIIDVKRPTLIRTFKKNITSLSTRQLNPDQPGCHTICGCTYDAVVPMVHKWKFEAEEEREVQRTALFDAVITNDNKEIIAVATLNGTVKIIQNGDEIAESEDSNERITSITMFENGNSIVYGTENNSVYVFNIKHNETKKLMDLLKPTYYTNVLKINDQNTIICQNDETDLKVWKDQNEVRPTRIVENTGTVIYSVLLESFGLIMAVSNELIKLWEKENWTLQLKYKPDNVTNIKCCSLGNGQKFLAIANAEGYLNVFKLSSTDIESDVKLEKILERKLNGEITACCFSNDETLLAVGLKNGNIVIIEMMSNSEKRTIKFHSKPIKQLYWISENIDEPILLSLSDELAWWSIKGFSSPVKIRENRQQGEKIHHSQSDQNIKRRNVNSYSDLTTFNGGKPKNFKQRQSLDSDSDLVIPSQFSQQLNGKKTNSTSLDSSIFENIRNSGSSASFLGDSNLNDSYLSNASSTQELWNDVKDAHSFKGLLNVIKLEGSSAEKICISKDFDNFITIDGEGSIYRISVFDKKLNDTSSINDNDPRTINS